MKEIWRDINWPNPPYQVSNLGRVRNALTGHIKKQGTLPYGYKRVYLGHKTQRYTHRLVAEAFIGPCPPGHEVNHLDGDKANNRPDNLEYVTHAENQRHAYRVLGTLKLNLPRGRGEKNTQAKLTEKEIRRIRLLASREVPQRIIAAIFDIKQAMVSNIVTRKSWQHV